ncbi:MULTISPECIES: hypothetical protein [unclassified Bradyrhizobium]|uniref:hypothetical protein n=1 Tax=unclassified Bradyrhizobium TaxID=2631580 RepID=UPI001FF9EDEA|nr:MULTISPECIES: hypothetical protein [unclassified Bradyrhizobium]
MFNNPLRSLADNKSMAIERLGIGIALLMLVEAGEIVESARDVGMIRAQHLVSDRKRTLECAERSIYR